MNGAITEPCTRVSSPPSMSMTVMIGANQSFLRTRRNFQSSSIKSIDVPKTDY